MARSDPHFATLRPGADASGTLVLCDLDGTLVLDNSFHVFMAACWSNGGLVQRLGLLVAIAPRMLGPMSGGHAGLKRRILLAFGRQPQAWQQKVVGTTLAKLRTTRSEPVARLLRDWRDRGARIVLATAAPDTYAAPFAAEHGAECVATPGKVLPGWQELLSQRKAAACLELISQRPKPQVVMVTDHRDDLPLLEIADLSLVQASAERYAAIVTTLSGKLGATLPLHLDPTAAQTGGGIWLWIDDRPHGPLDVWEVRTILSKHRHALLYVGGGRWARIGPGQPLGAAVRRADCPLPPASMQRLVTHLRRRLVRDLLGIYH